MEFLDKIIEELGFNTKLELAEKLGKDSRGYYSLERATDRISLKDLIRLRSLEGMTDKRLLDLLQEEAALEDKDKIKRRPKARQLTSK